MSKKKKKMQIHEILQFFVLTKRIRNKNRLIQNEVQIENVNTRIIK